MQRLNPQFIVYLKNQQRKITGIPTKWRPRFMQRPVVVNLPKNLINDKNQNSIPIFSDYSN